MTLIVRARSLRLLTRLNLDEMIFCRPLGDVFPIAVCCLEWISNLGTRLYRIEPVLRTLRTIDTSAPTVILLDSFFLSSSFEHSTMPIMSPHVITAFQQYLRWDNDIKRHLDAKTRARTVSITRSSRTASMERQDQNVWRPSNVRRNSAGSEWSV